MAAVPAKEDVALHENVEDMSAPEAGTEALPSASDKTATDKMCEALAAALQTTLAEIHGKNLSGRVRASVSFLGCFVSMGVKLVQGEFTVDEAEGVPEDQKDQILTKDATKTAGVQQKTKEAAAKAVDKLEGAAVAMDAQGLAGLVGSSVSLALFGTGVTVSLEVELASVILNIRASGKVPSMTAAESAMTDSLVSGLKSSSLSLRSRGWAGSVKGYVGVFGVTVMAGVVILEVDGKLIAAKKAEAKKESEQSASKFQGPVNKALDSVEHVAIAMDNRSLHGACGVSLSMSFLGTGFSYRFLLGMDSVLANLTIDPNAPTPPAPEATPGKAPTLAERAMLASQSGVASLKSATASVQSKMQKKETNAGKLTGPLLDQLTMAKTTLEGRCWHGRVTSTVSAIGVGLIVSVDVGTTEMKAKGDEAKPAAKEGDATHSGAQAALLSAMDTAETAATYIGQQTTGGFVGAGVKVKVLGTGISTSFDVDVDSINASVAGRTGIHSGSAIVSNDMGPGLNIRGDD